MSEKTVNTKAQISFFRKDRKKNDDWNLSTVLVKGKIERASPYSHARIGQYCMLRSQITKEDECEIRRRPLCLFLCCTGYRTMYNRMWYFERHVLRHIIFGFSMCSYFGTKFCMLYFCTMDYGWYEIFIWKVSYHFFYVIFFWCV